jgi:hypothetical protein
VAPCSKIFPVTERVKVTTLEVLGLNLDRDTGYLSDMFSDFLQSLQAYPRVVPLLDSNRFVLSFSKFSNHLTVQPYAYTVDNDSIVQYSTEGNFLCSVLHPSNYFTVLIFLIALCYKLDGRWFESRMKWIF